MLSFSLRQRASWLLCTLLLLLPVAVLWGANESSIAQSNRVQWALVMMQLFGGLALFLFGMEIMTDAVKTVAGDGMRSFLQKMAGNRFSGALSGALITAVLNSSSVTTVLVVGFISAGLMSLTQAISIIMGANIGSTIAAQIIAFNVTQYALLPIAVGFIMRGTLKNERHREIGETIMGLGLVFFGMGLMGTAMAPLRDYPLFLDLMLKMDKPILGIFIGAIFTALIQSSAATIGIAIAMASGGLINLEAGVALALGSNIGTCITAILAAIGKSRAAVRAAIAHVLINVIGVLIWVWLIPQLCDLARAISPSTEQLTGSEKMRADIPRQIANAHTFFNVANTCIFIWFTSLLTRLCEWLVPDKPELEKAIIKPMYLDKELLNTPSLALQRVQLEIGRIEKLIDEMFTHYKDAVWRPAKAQLRFIARRENDIEVLCGHILEYLASLPHDGLNKQESKQLLLLMTASNYLQGLGTTLSSDLEDILIEATTHKIEPSSEMAKLMHDVYYTVWQSCILCAQAISRNDLKLARQVLERASEVKQSINSALEHHAKLLTANQPNRLEILKIEMDFINKMKRAYNHAKRISKQQLKLASEDE